MHELHSVGFVNTLKCLPVIGSFVLDVDALGAPLVSTTLDAAIELADGILNSHRSKLASSGDEGSTKAVARDASIGRTPYKIHKIVRAAALLSSPECSK